MGYKVLIGLEMHCEISNTKTKVFSSAANSFSEKANTNIRPKLILILGQLIWLFPERFLSLIKKRLGFL